MARRAAAQSMSDVDPMRMATTKVKAARIGSSSNVRAALPEVFLPMV
jgi:hypothetical protein